MEDFRIRAALRARLLTVSSLPEQQWENEFYTPVPGTPYLKEHLMPTDHAIATFGGNGAVDAIMKDEGLWQISVFYPQGEGTKNAQAMVKEICAKFKVGTKLNYEGVSFTIMKIDVAPSIDKPVWYSVPITIKYLSHQAN